MQNIKELPVISLEDVDVIRRTIGCKGVRNKSASHGAVGILLFFDSLAFRTSLKREGLISVT